MSPQPDCYLYRADPIRVITPVSVDMVVDLGFEVSRELRFKIRGAELVDPDNIPRSMLRAVRNWFEAATSSHDGDGPALWLRSYKGVEDHAARYECDLARACDGDNFRRWLSQTYPHLLTDLDADYFNPQ